MKAIFVLEDKGLPNLPHQTRELNEARAGLASISPHAAKDLERAYAEDVALVREAAASRPQRALRVLQLESEMRADPARRADRFIETWSRLDEERLTARAEGDVAGARRAREAMGALAKGLERDPQLESLLQARRPSLGLDPEITGRRLGLDLAASLGLERSRGIGF